MQVAARSGAHAWKVLAPEPKRGFELLPPPSAGDLFFDIEGDPFWEPGRGLEYLWGFVDTARAFRPFWAHDRAEERRAVEATIDLIRVASCAGSADARVPLRRVRGVGAETAHVRVRHARGRARRAAARRGVRRPLQGRLAGPATVASALRPQAGRDVLLRPHGRSARRRRLDRALRGLPRASRRRTPRRHRRVQRRGLHLDARAARLAAAAATCAGAGARAARAARSARRHGGDRAAAPGAARRTARRSARDRRCRQVPLADGAAHPVPPPRGQAGLVGVLRQDRAHRRGAAGARFGGDRRDRADRARDRGRELAALPVRVPGATAPPRSAHERLRPGDRQAGRDDRGARRRGRDAAPATRPIARGRAAAGLAHARRPVLDARAAGRAAAPLACRALRLSVVSRSSLDPRAGTPPTAPPTGRPRRRAAARRGTRREAPLHPGPARLGQDLHGRASDRPPDLARPARRRDLHGPQGDP